MFKSRNPEIPSLTGLRFFAAFAIVLNHLLLGYVARDNPWLGTMLALCGSLGMNAFFVLSGFIIHYNYGAKLADFRLHSFYEFMVARIARLYPLFILLFALEIFTSSAAMRAGPWAVLQSLPYYLTMTQTWGYVRIDGALLPYMYERSNLTWSISTEMLMYILYPLLLWLILRDRLSHAGRIAAAVVICLALSFALRWSLNNPQAMDKVGVALFGPTASIAHNFSTSFSFWFNFLSPYARFLEFAIGVLTCHLYFTLRDRPVGAWEARIVPLLGLSSVLFILATFLPPAYAAQPVTDLLTAIGYYPFMAMIIFCCARYDRAMLTRFFSVPAFVRWGEYSYSIYLFHIFVYYAASQGPASDGMQIVRVFVAFATIIFCAKMLYTYVEMPGRRWLRAWLGSFWPKPAPAQAAI